MDQDPLLTEALAKVYEPLLERLRQQLPSENGFSLPLLMAPSPEYARAPVKLMIVGQETNKWYSPLHDLAQFPSARAIQNKYSEFGLGVGYKNSPFWRAATHIQKSIGVDRLGFLWTNLFICDCDAKTAPIEFHDILRNLSPFRNELEIVKPDAVVFFTGTSFDYTLKYLFSDVSFQSTGSDGQYLHYLEDVDGPSLMLRTYHPNYLVQQQKWSTIENICALIKARFAV